MPKYFMTRTKLYNIKNNRGQNITFTFSHLAGAFIQSNQKQQKSNDMKALYDKSQLAYK